MSRTGAEIRARPVLHFVDNESKSKFIQDRISTVEKHFGQLCDTMSSFTRKCARLRDKGDQLAKDLVDYTEAETHNPGLVRSMSEFASSLSTIQDYRQAQVTRLESKVVQPLANYGPKCKNTKSDIKAAFTAQDREINQKKRLEKIRQKAPGDRAQLSQAETELQKASVEASRVTKNLEQQTDKFELEKLKDFKKIMLDFINIEMIFHARALEMYSECFQNVKAFDVDEDIDEFRSKLQPPNSATRINMVRSSSYTSLDSTGQTTPPRLSRQTSAPTSKTNTPIKAPVRLQPQVRSPATNDPRLRNGHRQQEEDDDDDEDDEEEETDEDDDEDDSDLETETETETARTTARSSATETARSNRAPMVRKLQR